MNLKTSTHLNGSGVAKRCNHGRLRNIQKWTFAIILVAMGMNPVKVEAQQNWDRFRGPNGSGVSLDSKLPDDCSSYLWQADLKGTGSSSPVIWQDKLFITSCDSRSAELYLHCFDRKSGKEIWTQTFNSDPYRLHSRNSFASATPAVDEKHVYLTYADPEHTWLIALNHDGQKAWSRDFGTWKSQHGFGISPQVYKELVILFNSQQAQRVRSGKPGTSRVIAVDRKDGSDVWTTPLTATRTCYAMPTVFTSSDGKDHLISCNTGDGFFSLDPESGAMDWSVLPFQMRTVASTVVADGIVIGSCGSGGGGNYMVAIDVNQEQPTKAYQLPKANYVPSPIVVGKRLFFFTDRGIANCVDLATGNPVWSKRLAGGFSGSPVATKDKIYIMDEDGVLHVLSTSDTFKILGKHELGEGSRSTPAIYGDQLFLRTESKLFCVGSES